MSSLEGKAVVVTGAGGGIGSATCLAFAAQGARILAADVNGDEAEETARRVRDAGAEAQALAVDVTSEREVEGLVRTAVSTLGGLDVMVNNAGVLVTGKVEDDTEEAFDRCFAVNVKGVWLGCKHAIRHMVGSGGGAIVNTGSISGVLGVPAQSIYCASKGAVVILTKQLAVDYAEHGIRVNAVCPGAVDTRMTRQYLESLDDPEQAEADFRASHPLGRLARPEEIADGIVYLAGASFVTGHALMVDGGYTAI